MTSITEASEHSSSSAGPAWGDVSTGDWTTPFLAILNNHGKRRVVPGAERLPVRTRGFVVLVRDRASLRPLQDLCARRDWNDCLVARYRLIRGPVFATLSAAFLDDLAKLRKQPDLREQDTTGIVRFDPSGGWAKAIQEGFLARSLDDTRNPARARTGALDPEWLELFLGELQDERFLPMQTRLLLLCELQEPQSEPDEWERARSDLLERLPERVGIVLSGVEAALDPTDPHYLELPSTGGAEAEPARVEGGYEYMAAALRSDRPAAEDQLGVGTYATALAKFVLHPDTTPLTVGIHGPWGKGKSSFMRFVGDALVVAASPSPVMAADSSPRWHSLRRAVQYRATGEPSLTERVRHRLLPMVSVEQIRALDSVIATLEDQREPSLPADESVASLQRRLEWTHRARARVWRKLRRGAVEKVVTVSFNAWRFEDSSQIWAGLASEITKGLESALPWWRRRLTPLAYACRNRKVELCVDLVVPFLAAAILLALAVAGAGHLQSWIDRQGGASPLGRLLGNVLPVGGAVLLGVWIVAGRVQRVLQPVSERVLTYIRRPDYRERMGYQHVVLEDIRFVQRRLKRARPKCRAVVFIDDLDRCSDDKIMQILQAINLILGENEFYVFLGIDTAMIHRAIASHYVDRGGQPLAKNFPESYLRKIIQLQFHLPASDANARTDFLQRLFSPSARKDRAVEGASADETTVSVDDSSVGRLTWDSGNIVPLVEHVFKPVEDTPEELHAFEDYHQFVNDNPRELKRLINVHRFVKILIEPAELSLTEANQRKLVKWLIFCSRWHELVDDVLEFAERNPGSKNCIAGIARGRPTEERALLREFAATTDKDDPLSADDLLNPAWLMRAAKISQLVEREETPPNAGARRRGTEPAS
jgi:hypothetical protein